MDSAPKVVITTRTASDGYEQRIGDATYLTEGHRDWASLPLPVADKVIRVLKDTRRWRLDGRSLRLLNRHWSAAVTMHVEEIRPDFTRSIVDKDIASLPKFERATSTDLSAFLIRPPKHELPRNRRKKKLFMENWYGTKLERIVDVLCQLPDLKQIEVGLKAMSILHDHYARSGEQFSRLEKIAAVYFYEGENLKLYGKTPWNTTRMALPSYRKHQLDYSTILAQLVCSLERLETLEVDRSVLDSCSQFGCLERVKHVTVHGANHDIFTRLSNPSGVVSFVATSCSDTIRLDTLLKQNRLDGLNTTDTCINCMCDFFHAHIARYLKALEVSIMRVPGGRLELLVETFDTLVQLECLTISGWEFLGASMRGRLLISRH